jgi:Protein of unknown function (DUF2637)
MTEYPADRGNRTRDLAPRLRLAALTAVILGVVLLAVAAFLLSYSGIHHIALQAGVSPRLARLYPVIFDAMLVIASAAVLALRGAGWPTRCYVWLCLIVLLAAVAAGDAVYATGTTLPRQPARAVVAVIPWALLLLAFGLLLAMLRHRRRARAKARERAGAEPPVASTGHVSLLEPRPGEPPALPLPGHQPPAGTAAQPAPAPAQAAAAQPAAAGAAAGPHQPPEYQAGSYAGAGEYDPAHGYAGTEEFLGTEEYGGTAEYPETDEYHEAAAVHTGSGPAFGEWAAGQAGPEAASPGTQPPGGEAPPGATEPGEERDDGQQDTPRPGGEPEGDGGQTAAVPAPAPVPHFDRMRSTPTRPQD